MPRANRLEPSKEIPLLNGVRESSESSAVQNLTRVPTQKADGAPGA